MTKGIIYYTDNRLDENIFKTVQKQLSDIDLPIVSVSLKPIDFGQNIVLDLQPSIVTLFTQILTALEASTADIVFHCEHDVLYHPSHFEFIPPENNIFYYNTNVWRWKYPEDLAITYEHITSLSCLCADRQLLIKNYKERLRMIKENGWDKDTSREPHWARRMGYEPGTKSVRQKLIVDGICQYWRSEYPNIDIRHSKTLTKTKCSRADFKHPPPVESWKEKKLDEIEGWNLKTIFNI
jgi:hypothetical protein